MLPIIIRAGKILGDKNIPNFTALANAIKCHRSSLYTWQRIPSHYVDKIVKATGGKITASQLRPDLAKAEKQVQRQKNKGRKSIVCKSARGEAVSGT